MIEFFTTTISIESIIILSLAALLAGFIDAVVGGGGLIQLPALLIQMPQTAIPTLFGINKIAALSGTSMAAYNYSRKVKFNFTLLGTTGFAAFLASYAGAKAVTYIPPASLKPLILILLIVIAIYTFLKKDFGSSHSKNLSTQKQITFGVILALLVGFYDGFFGPGTGSFFVFGFVFILGFDFLKASAYSKIINCITNISALIVFINNGNFILYLALIMASFNIIGSLIGTHLALRRGNSFIKNIFFIVVSIMILRYGYDILFVK